MHKSMRKIYFLSEQAELLMNPFHKWQAHNETVCPSEAIIRPPLERLIEIPMKIDYCSLRSLRGE